METTSVPAELRDSRKRRKSNGAPSRAASGRMRAQGLHTRNMILRVARSMLLESGPVNFSQRAVALRAGISVSNLQYYFPTKLAILRAVAEPEVDSYLRALKRMLDSSIRPREIRDAIVKRSLHDAKNAEYAALLRHFFSFASTDPECAKLLSDWYNTLTLEFAKLIHAVNPEFGTADSVHVATLLIALADGLTLQLVEGRHRQVDLPGLEARYIATVNCILLGSNPGVADD
ncbi:TetR/AcrR family transcriptional regulator [Burkholderia aenigmatica]|uniref:TetR family transcriptional regulator n=1 Tax=Burkholderia aenigmatica TaxID=2015348 RepID=A0A228HTP6_9BURK|nr:TetR/AcrR family transcriptional regulator [Burkholderia aenigmatica]OXI33536.1 TetR family transcriptional regulator [Burkholderia aenigmatica]